MVVYPFTSLDAKSTFGKRAQQLHETVEEFAKALGALALECGKENEDEQIAEHFVDNMALSDEFKMWWKSRGYGRMTDYTKMVDCASAMEHGAKHGRKHNNPSVVIGTAHFQGKNNHYDNRGVAPESDKLNSDDSSVVLSGVDKIFNRMSICGQSKDIRDEIDHLDRQFPRGSYNCKGCKTEITRIENEAPVPGYPLYGVKKNPYGYEFKTITCTNMYSIKEVSERTTNYTWFKGYAWTILRCINCEKHMGWKFYNESGEEKLETFFCLVLDAVDVSCAK